MDRDAKFEILHWNNTTGHHLELFTSGNGMTYSSKEITPGHESEILEKIFRIIRKTVLPKPRFEEAVFGGKVYCFPKYFYQTVRGVVAEWAMIRYARVHNKRLIEIELEALK